MVYEEHIENLLDVVEGLLAAGEVEQAVRLLENRHAADQADLIEHLDREDQEKLVRALTPEQLGDILEHLSEDHRRQIVDELPVDALAPILNYVYEELAADIVQDLPEERQHQILPLLDERDWVTELLSYPEQSAGGRMSPDFVTLQRGWTVHEAIEFLRQEAPDTNRPFYLYVVDDAGRLAGTVSLRSLVTAPPATSIGAITNDDVISVVVTDDQEVAAERMRHYNLLALPVVDEEGRIRGVITPDSVLDVQVEEATEDMYRMVGLEEEERIFRPIRESVPPRLAWLMVNLVTAFLAASTVSIFEGTIADVAALAVFMPMVAGMGGNAGIQTITLVVRSIALGEVGPTDATRVIRHELVIALIKGVVIGLIVGTVAWLWKDSAWLGLIAGFALLANILNATLIGVLVPMTLKRLKADPALASGVIVTTFSDVVGLLFFLGLATLLVTRLT